MRSSGQALAQAWPGTGGWAQRTVRVPRAIIALMAVLPQLQELSCPHRLPNTPQLLAAVERKSSSPRVAAHLAEAAASRGRAAGGRHTAGA